MTKLLGHFIGQVKCHVTRGHQRSKFAVLDIFFTNRHITREPKELLSQKNAFDSTFNALLLLSLPILTKIIDLAKQTFFLRKTYFGNNS